MFAFILDCKHYFHDDLYLSKLYYMKLEVHLTYRLAQTPLTQRVNVQDREMT